MLAVFLLVGHAVLMSGVSQADVRAAHGPTLLEHHPAVLAAAPDAPCMSVPAATRAPLTSLPVPAGTVLALTLDLTGERSIGERVAAPTHPPDRLRALLQVYRI